MPADSHDPARPAGPGAKTRPASRPTRPGSPKAPGNPGQGNTADPTQGSAGYRDRPADEGKHGDAAEEPNGGVP